MKNITYEKLINIFLSLKIFIVKLHKLKISGVQFMLSFNYLYLRKRY